MMVHDHRRPSADLARFDGGSGSSSSSSSSSSVHRTDTPASPASVHDDRSRRRRPSGHAPSTFGRSSHDGLSSAGAGPSSSSSAGWAAPPPSSAAAALANGQSTQSFASPSFGLSSTSRPSQPSSSRSSFSAAGSGDGSPRTGEGGGPSHHPRPSAHHLHHSSGHSGSSSRSPSKPHAGQDGSSHGCPSSPTAPSSTSSSSTARPPSPAASSHTARPASSASSFEAARHTSTTPDIPPPASLVPPRTSSSTHLDLVTYPAQDLVRLLAALLQQIASANDALRKEEGDEGGKDKAAGLEDDAHSRHHHQKSASTSTSTSGRSSPSGGRRHQPSSPPRASEGAGAMQADDEDEDGRPMSRPPSLESTSSAASNQSDAPPRTPSDPLGPVTSAFTSTPRTSFETASPHPVTFAQPSTSSSEQPSRHTPSPTPQNTTTPTPGSGPSQLVAPRHLSASLTAFKSSSSSLCFHARNVPGINIEVYLQRILKYCPASNEVFLSLLVYFDRMSKLSMEVGGKAFAIDSFNVHRLVIAGVTVASKFFSDVFYTNSRYAKVGGLPQSELNQLELQFLLLNDFNLAIPLEEMQRYGDQLLLYSQTAPAVE